MFLEMSTGGVTAIIVFSILAAVILLYIITRIRIPKRIGIGINSFPIME